MAREWRTERARFQDGFSSTLASMGPRVSLVRPSRRIASRHQGDLTIQVPETLAALAEIVASFAVGNGFPLQGAFRSFVYSVGHTSCRIKSYR